LSDRRRNLFILLLVAGLVIASAVAVVTQPTRLGLDLRGGVELVYEARPTPQAPVVTQEALDRAIDVMRDRVDRLGVAEPEIQRSGAGDNPQITVQLPNVQNAQRAQEQVGTVAQLYFYDWETSVLGPGCEPAPDDPSVTGGAAAGQAGGIPLYDAVRRAASCEGAPEERDNSRTGPAYYLVDDARDRVLGGPEENREDLPSGGRPGEDQRVLEVPEGITIIRQEVPEGIRGPVDRWYVLDDDVALRGTEIRNPEQNFDPQTNEPVVTFDFTDRGAERWQEVTREIAQRGARAFNPAIGVGVEAARQHFAIVLDDELISVPYIDFQRNPNGIDGSTGSQISGGFTIESAQELATLLQTGALPVRLEPISQSQVSATLGQQALDQSVVAGLVGFAVVALFLVAFYRVLGVIAVAALGVYALFFYALIELIPVTLTLPGIAGLILTIGVAADANIVIFERVKEEIRNGRSIQSGIATGYRKGLTAIIDANVVTVMVAFILFVLATAGVRGFALTLGVGTLVSFFCAVLFTQAILGTMGRSRLLQSRSALGAGEQKRRWTFDFMGASRWFFSMSGVILAIGALGIGGQGLNFGIDFESGTRIRAALERPATEDQVRSVLADAEADDAEIQRVEDPGLGENVFSVSTESLGPREVDRVRDGLEGEFGLQNFNSESIGPTFGETVANSAIVAVIASLVVISAYIALRFEWKFAVPVLIAVMHDILITAGAYSLLGAEVTTASVAALLTILGFSLYDTIIVFDRIRENIPRMPRAAFSQIVNRSMSEVLTRSLATSFCTLLPMLGLFFFGGETLREFALALIIGTLSGTYSSVFIASPLLTHWKEREGVWRRRRAAIEAELGHVPAYATAVGGAPVDIVPREDGRARPARRLTAPEDPQRQVSREEFDDMVRDLDVEETERAAARSRRQATAVEEPAPRGRRAPRARAPEPEGDGGAVRMPEPDPAADARPEDVVMPDDAGRRERERRPRNRRHGRPR